MDTLIIIGALVLLVTHSLTFLCGYDTALKRFDARDRKQAETQRWINHQLRGSD